MDSGDPLVPILGIEPELDTLRSMVEPKSQGPGGFQMLASLGLGGDRAFQRNETASVLLFLWGTHLLPVFLTSVAVAEKAHLPSLVPLPRQRHPGVPGHRGRQPVLYGREGAPGGERGDQHRAHHRRHRGRALLMLLKGSRYLTARTFSPATGGRDTFPGLRPRAVATLPGVVEHTVIVGDRLDLLARHYYNDDRLWWRIVDANPEVVFAGDLLDTLAEGTIILIPAGRS